MAAYEAGRHLLESDREMQRASLIFMASCSSVHLYFWSVLLKWFYIGYQVDQKCLLCKNVLKIKLGCMSCHL